MGTSEPDRSERAARQPSPAEVTQVLSALEKGDQHATDELLSLVYDELRRLAKSRLSNEPGAGAGMTLQATALVHEAYLRLIGPLPKSDNDADGATSAGDSKKSAWNSRGHFFGAAALAMQRILVERARHQRRLKHGGGKDRVDLDKQDVAQPPAEFDRVDIIALDEAIKQLEKLNPRKARIVTLRYFAGLSIQETAAAMDLSVATVKTDWAFARAWLHRELSGAEGVIDDSDNAASEQSD
jgi:RNA polymerase sigma factor (sigma-70 family)